MINVMINDNIIYKYKVMSYNDHLVSVLFGDLLGHSYNITNSVFLYLVPITVNSPNCGHFGTIKGLCPYSESVLYSGVRVMSSHTLMFML